MAEVLTENLAPGMVITKAVYAHDGTLLLPPGTELETAHLKQLRESGINSVQVKNPIQSRRDVKHISTKQATLHTVKSVFRKLTLKDMVEAGSVKSAVSDILYQVVKDRNIMAHLTDVRSLDNYVFTHSVNVCMLSLLIGFLMQLPGEELKELGMAALLHDVGLHYVPQDLLYKRGGLAPEEYETVRKHTIYGYERLKSSHGIPATAAQVAWQHHERSDGSGYPFGIKGTEIHLFARIVAVADVFDALLADRPFRKAFFPHQAVEIIADNGGQFDTEIVGIFLNNVVIYPLGSVVRLNTGDVAVVVDMNKSSQTRPVVRLICSREGKRVASMFEVDLSKSRDTYIVQVLKEEQVELLF
jgi:HD-GYP domain-containing protein (c-di-GMP phosphodiesterase class II)